MTAIVRTIYSGLMPVLATSARHLLGLAADARGDGLRRTGIGIEALLAHRLDGFGIVEDRDHLAVELVHNRIRRAGGHDVGDPERHVVVLHAGLDHGRHVRQR